MARMPAGQPRSVPDPDGEAYEEMLRRERLNATALNSRSATLALPSHSFQSGVPAVKPSLISRKETTQAPP